MNTLYFAYSLITLVNNIWRCGKNMNIYVVVCFWVNFENVSIQISYPTLTMKGNHKQYTKCTMLLFVTMASHFHFL